MTGWILKLVLLIVVIRALMRLVRGITDGIRNAATPQAVPLVRDPICGTFVSPSTAPSFGSGAAMRFFCSDTCLRAYQAKFPK
jgi:YHS domain-containing protein